MPHTLVKSAIFFQEFNFRFGIAEYLNQNTVVWGEI